MSRTFALLLTVLLAATALAGCMRNEDDPPATTTPGGTPTTTTPLATPIMTTPGTTPPGNGTTPLDSSTFALAAVGAPAQVRIGGAANFTLFVNGSANVTSDHVGAHFANNDSTNPPAAGRSDCNHVGGALPGTYNVTCAMAQAGAWYVWGHARVNDSGTERSWWTATPFVVKARDYNVTLSAPTQQQASRSNFTVTVNVTALGGSDNATGEVNVYVYNETTASPSASGAAGSCTPVGTGVVGTHAITCSVTREGLLPGTHYLRARILVAEGGTALDWWSSEATVTIGPVGAPALPGP